MLEARLEEIKHGQPSGSPLEEEPLDLPLPHRIPTRREKIYILPFPKGEFCSMQPCFYGVNPIPKQGVG